MKKKKKYEAPEIRVLVIDSDVITTSLGIDDTGYGIILDWEETAQD